MRHILFDTNVVLDVLLDRQPHAMGSAAIWAAVETGRAKGFVSAHSITTVHYLVTKEAGSAKARRTIAAIMRLFEVAAVDRAVLEEAVLLALPDFEDSVTAAAAKLAGCDFVVTRDLKGFRGSPVRHATPEICLPLLNAD